VEIRLSQSGFPILDQFSEDGFVDCVFKITDIEEDVKTYKFNLQASYNGNDLGFGVEVVKNIKAGFDSEMQLIQNHIYRKGIKFSRTGIESDTLLNVLAGLYGLSQTQIRMTNEETFTVIALHQGEIDITTEPIKLKIFGKDQDDDLEENYYESFFNLDLRNGFVFWNEKDHEYREPLIRGLSA
jgi:hypothetical protein